MLQAKREYLARELAAIGFDVLPAQVIHASFFSHCGHSRPGAIAPSTPVCVLHSCAVNGL